MFEKNVQKSSTISKKVENGIFLIKKVDNDAIRPINVRSTRKVFYVNNLEQRN